MSNIGKLTTFSRLLNEESVIMIPKVQRDYAYGRKEAKVMDILDGMLDNMFEAVADSKPAILDFVFGGSFVKKNDKASGLIPLDGQQRLTTLFLLHFYASLVQDGISYDEVKCLKKFRYETRQSATDFCDSLIDGIRDSLLVESDGVKAYNNNTSIVELIKDNPLYLPNYDSDPTISSMLNVLEAIEAKYRERPIENFWTKLFKNDDIRFYSLSLEKFGLTDDLYIKMNSRGKKLTVFEIFKSDLEKAIYKISPTLKDELSIKIDNNWMDVVWEYAYTTTSSSEKENDMIERADAGFMTLFNNIFRMEMFRRGLETKNNRTPGIEEIITDELSIKVIISIFDMLSDIQKAGGIRKFWDKYFYFSDDMEGESDKVRLFWMRKELRKPVFYLGMEKDWSVPETVYFYTIYLLHKSKKADDIIAKCLRICRNLVTANVRANSARYDMLPGFMKDMEYVVASDGRMLDNPDKTFVATAWDEEVYKCTWLGEDEYKELLKYENHNILQGSVMLFIDKYGVDGTALSDALSHFAGIFCNDAKPQTTKDMPSDFNRIRINLLNKDKEYMQARRWMINEQNGIYRRLFLHKWEDLNLFFIKNTDLALQDNILTVLEEISSYPTLKSVEDKTEEFGRYDWQYYMVKYEGSYRKDSKGVYLWEDKENRPLEVILLNSQYHSEYNLEWVMLNHILISEIWDDNRNYSLDPHACSPVTLNKLGPTLTFTQKGWKITCNHDIAVEALKSNALLEIAASDSEENVYIANFGGEGWALDYIDLAKVIISTIEEAFQ